MAMEAFGESIKKLREEKELPLRKVAAFLDIDQAVLSKFEHGIRVPKREQVIQLAQYFKADANILLVKWLAEKILGEINNEELGLEALQLAEARITTKSNKFKKGLTEKFNILKLSESVGIEHVPGSGKLPSYIEFARYLFITATGEKFNENAVNIHSGYIGESANHEVYLFYRPDAEWLTHNALTLNMIKELPAYKGKQRLVFASLKYVNDETCNLHHIEFCQLPHGNFRVQIPPTKKN